MDSPSSLLTIFFNSSAHGHKAHRPLKFVTQSFLSLFPTPSPAVLLPCSFQRMTEKLVNLFSSSIALNRAADWPPGRQRRTGCTVEIEDRERWRGVNPAPRGAITFARLKGDSWIEKKEIKLEAVVFWRVSRFVKKKRKKRKRKVEKVLALQ